MNEYEDLMMIADMFTSAAGFSSHFSTIFHPISGEYDLLGKHPNCAHTIKSVSKYETAMEELRASVGPELELVESRVVGPVKEYQSVLKTIRKTITKRNHKVRGFAASSCVDSDASSLTMIASTTP